VFLRRQGRDILWHKELLLNAALKALPATCTKVVWVDCDIVFDDDAWAMRLEEELDRHRLVQAFSHFHWLDANQDRYAARRRPPGAGLIHLIEQGQVADAHFREGGTALAWGYSPGLAWAARREILDAVGFYDALILGSGDRAFLSAAYGRHEDCVEKLRMNEAQARHYLAWAEAVAERFQGDVVALPGAVLHLWHGERKDRGYARRYEELARHDFDPSTDIARDPGGGWRWASDKPDLHAFVARYFRDRREGPTLRATR
jgi:hypothetical protein